MSTNESACTTFPARNRNTQPTDQPPPPDPPNNTFIPFGVQKTQRVMHIRTDKIKTIKENGEKIKIQKIVDRIATGKKVFIDITISKHSNLTSFTVSGPPASVDAAYAQLVADLTVLDSITLPVSQEMRKIISGAQGARKKALEQATKTKISIPRANEEGAITIEGEPANINDARAQILAWITQHERRTTKSIEINQITGELLFGPYFHAFNAFFGNKEISTHAKFGPRTTVSLTGDVDVVDEEVKNLEAVCKTIENTQQCVRLPVLAAIRKYFVKMGREFFVGLHEASQCVVTVSDILEPPSLFVHGAEEHILKGTKLVCEKALERVVIACKIPKGFFRYLKACENTFFYDFQQETKADVLFKESYFEIMGAESSVRTARQLLEEKLEHFAQFVVKDLEVDPALYKFVIGKQGANLKRIHAQFDVKLLIPTDDSSEILIIAKSEESADAAACHVLKTIDGLKASGVTHITTDAAFVEYLDMHKDKVREILHAHAYARIVPKPESSSIMIQGTFEQIAGIKNAIEAAHKEYMRKISTCTLHVEEFIVSAQFSDTFLKTAQQIAGNCNVGLRTAPGTARNSVVYTLSGAQMQVEKARGQMHQRIEQMSQATEVPLTVDSRHHGKIIGRDGKHVKSLQARYFVRLVFPDIQEKSNVVKARGPSCTIKLAVDEIMEYYEYVLEHAFEEKIEVPVGYARVFCYRNYPSVLHVCDEKDVRVTALDKGDACLVFLLEGSRAGIRDVQAAYRGIAAEIDGFVEEGIAMSEFEGARNVISTHALRDIADRQRIEVLQNTSHLPNGRIRVRGLPANFNPFRAELATFFTTGVAASSSDYVRKVTVPRCLDAREEAFVYSLKEKYGVHATLTATPGGTLVVLKGKGKSFDTAHKLILAFKNNGTDSYEEEALQTEAPKARNNASSDFKKKDFKKNEFTSSIGASFGKIDLNNDGANAVGENGW